MTTIESDQQQQLYVPTSPTVGPFLTTSEEKHTFNTFKTVTLTSILENVQYDELWGYQLTTNGEFYQVDIVDSLMFKFLKANDFDLKLAEDQLTKTLQWRKEFKPLKAAFLEKHDGKFQGIGMLTYYESLPEIITWNLYGESDGDHEKIPPGELFADVDAFLRYRIGLMERSLQLCQFDNVSLSKISQVHDYKGVSFLRFDSRVKAGSKAVIKVFQDYYPELLDRKFFVNVPLLAQWIYDLVVLTWLPEETVRKFTLLSDARSLRGKIGSEEVPEKYGGKGESLTEQSVMESDVKMTEYTKHLIETVYNLET